MVKIKGKSKEKKKEEKVIQKEMRYNEHMIQCMTCQKKKWERLGTFEGKAFIRLHKSTAILQFRLNFHRIYSF